MTVVACSAVVGVTLVVVCSVVTCSVLTESCVVGMMDDSRCGVVDITVEDGSEVDGITLVAVSIVVAITEVAGSADV